MKTVCRSGVLVALALAAVQGAAWGAQSPLLVSVEVAPGVNVAPADVRRAVATELGTTVVGTREPTADSAADVLLVALDPREIRMSLRASAAPIVSRTIAVPSDRTGRLRSIGWLAGNLVRDQIGPIVATSEVPPAPPVEAHPAVDPPLVAASAPPPLVAVDPPPVAASAPPASAASTPRPGSSTPAAVVASPPASAVAAIPHAAWSITVSGGPAMSVMREPIMGQNVMHGSAYQIEVQRQSPDGILVGVALKAGPDLLPHHYLSGAVFAGEAWRRRAWFVETTLGLGVGAIDGLQTTGMTIGDVTTGASTTTQQWTSVGWVPELFVRAAGTGGVQLSRLFDLVAQLGAHLSSDGDRGSYGSAVVGMRVRLP
jgi:hypothetical protein